MQLLRDFRGEMSLGQAYDAGMEVHAAKARGVSLPIEVTIQMAAIESASMRHVAARTVTLDELQIPSPIGLQKATNEVTISAGWKEEP